MNQVQIYEKETGEKVFTKQYQNDRGEPVDVHKVAYVKHLEDKIQKLENMVNWAVCLIYNHHCGEYSEKIIRDNLSNADCLLHDTVIEN